MEDGKIFEVFVGFKEKGSRFGIPKRRDSLKVACLAGDPHMGIMGHLFFVGQMALQTVHGGLPVMAECGGVFVAFGAGHVRMGSGIIGFTIHQWDVSLRFNLCFGAVVSMTVETEGSGLFNFFWAFLAVSLVTGHAGCVLIWERG